MKWIGLMFSALLVAALGCSEKPGRKLRIFHAGSLSVPFQRMEAEFEARNPDVDVQREAYGSAAAIRQVTELGRPADVVASADYRLIDQMMIGVEEPFADYNVLFARNSIGIAYTELPDGLNRETWPQMLAGGELTYGMSDANQDPCGYRSLFCVALTGGEELLDRLVLSRSNMRAEAGGDGITIQVPSVTEPEQPLVMRPKETDLLALLESDVIDCLFIYRSVAKQHGLGFLELSDKANLSNPRMAERYARVHVRQYSDQPERSVTVTGSPIVYGATVPKQAPNAELGRRFLEFTVSERGRAIMEEAGQPPFDPALYSPASRTENAPFDLESIEG